MLFTKRWQQFRTFTQIERLRNDWELAFGYPIIKYSSFSVYFSISILDDNSSNKNIYMIIWKF